MTVKHYFKFFSYPVPERYKASSDVRNLDFTAQFLHIHEVAIRAPKDIL
jgi:hypothetical protein